MSLDVISAITGQSPAIVVAILSLYFLNKNYIESLRERREILENIRKERLEWMATMQRIADRYDTRLAAAIEAAADVKNQIHALRGTLTDFMLRIDPKWRNTQRTSGQD